MTTQVPFKNESKSGHESKVEDIHYIMPEYLDVSSSNRRKRSEIYIGKVFPLTVNPFLFENDSKIISVTHKNHPFSVGDQVLINNAKGNIFSLINPFTGDGKNLNIVFDHGLTVGIPTNDLYLEMIAEAYDDEDIPFFLNTTHKIIEIKEDCIMVTLQKDPTTALNFNSYNYTIKLQYKFIDLISLSNINTDEPLTASDDLRTIINISEDGNSYDIQLTKNASFPNDQGETHDVGGTEVTISEILSFDPAYINTNFYKLPIKKPYHQVTNVRIVSSTFPTGFPGIKKNINDKLYWQFIDNDINIVNTITVPPHVYQTSELINTINKQMSTTDGEETLRLEFNNVSRLVEIFGFKINMLSNPLKDMYGSTLSINMPDHNLSSGDKIKIEDSFNHKHVPYEALNSYFTITKIDNDNFTIDFEYFHPLSDWTFEGGGTFIKILTPINFRLRMDYSDSLGKFLGFREIGKTNSITSFNTCITNRHKYIEDFDKLTTSIEIPIIDETYFYLSCAPFNYLKVGNMNVFTKIIISDPNREYLFDTFTSANVIFPHPIDEVSELDIALYDSNGNLYEAGAKEHSFVIEISTLIKMPDKKLHERFGKPI
jgi:hypothetical protein